MDRRRQTAQVCTRGKRTSGLIALCWTKEQQKRMEIIFLIGYSGLAKFRRVPFVPVYSVMDNCDILWTEICLIQIGNCHAWLFVHRWKMEWINSWLWKSKWWASRTILCDWFRFHRLIYDRWSLIYYIEVWPKLLLTTKTCVIDLWEPRMNKG